MLRITKILCPVDFFPGSERIADHAIALAKNYNAKLILLHVVTPVITAYELPYNSVDMITPVVEASKDELKKVAKRAEANKVAVESIVSVGDVDIEIRDTAKRRNADLIVMGSHGRRGFQKWFLGSHTERLLRRTDIPLMTIAGTATQNRTLPSIRRMMVLTNFEEGTADAIRYAMSIGQECQSRVTLMHVLNDIDASISGRYRDPLMKSIRLQLEALIPEDARDWCDVETRVETGLPWRRILKVLEKEKFDLLVMNIHGKNMIDRALLGSTAERVVRGATIPVLWIPRGKVRSRKMRRTKKVA